MTGTQCRLQAAAPCWANIRSCYHTCLLTSWGVAQAASQVRGPPLWCPARCGSQGLPSLAAGWTHPSPLPWHSPPLRTKGSVVVQVPHRGDQETPPLAHTAHPGVRPSDGEQILKPGFEATGAAALWSCPGPTPASTEVSRSHKGEQSSSLLFSGEDQQAAWPRSNLPAGRWAWPHARHPTWMSQMPTAL